MTTITTIQAPLAPPTSFLGNHGWKIGGASGVSGIALMIIFSSAAAYFGGGVLIFGGLIFVITSSIQKYEDNCFSHFVDVINGKKKESIAIQQKIEEQIKEKHSWKIKLHSCNAEIRKLQKQARKVGLTKPLTALLGRIEQLKQPKRHFEEQLQKCSDEIKDLCDQKMIVLMKIFDLEQDYKKRLEPPKEFNILDDDML
jgi:hypothetical protein